LFFTHTSTTLSYTLSLHDALPISEQDNRVLMLHHNILKRYLQPGGHIEPSDQNPLMAAKRELVEETQIDAENLVYKCVNPLNPRSEEHTSELQSRFDLVCRLLLEK